MRINSENRVLKFFIILTSILCLCACTSHSGANAMPNFINSLELSLNMTSEMMYGDNEEYLEYKTDDRQPMDTVFRGFSFPSGSVVEANFAYPNGSIEINNVSSVRAMGDYSVKNFSLPNITIATFLRGANPINITDKEAFEQVNKIFKQLETKGWVFNFDINAPRITFENAVKYALADGDTSYLDFRYPLSFDEFNQITSYRHYW